MLVVADFRDLLCKVGEIMGALRVLRESLWVATNPGSSRGVRTRVALRLAVVGAVPVVKLGGVESRDARHGI